MFCIVVEIGTDRWHFLIKFVFACRHFMFETTVLRTCPLPMPEKLLYRACIPKSSTVTIMCRIKDKAWKVLECKSQVERIKIDAIALGKLAKKWIVRAVWKNNDFFPWKKLGYNYHAMQQARKVLGKAWCTEFAATLMRWWVTIDEENETIKHFVDVGFGESSIHPLWYKFIWYTT
jgi:hypothetical protein